MDSWEVVGISDSGTVLRWLSSHASLCLPWAISARSHIHTVCPIVPPPYNFSSLPSPYSSLIPLSPLESWRVMWTAREEGWEKDERSVKEESDVVGVIAESSSSLVRLAAPSVWVCVCVCSVCFPKNVCICLSVWGSCTLQSISVFACVCVCVCVCVCLVAVVVWWWGGVFPCVCVYLYVLMVHP